MDAELQDSAVEVKKPKRTPRNGTAIMVAPSTTVASPVAAPQMDLLRSAVERGAGIEVIERLKALYDQERNRIEEMEFNAAMNRVQASLTRIAPDLNNPQTRSKYASYAAIDKVLRPVYSHEGFSLSFNTEDSAIPEHLKIVCYVSHSGGHTRVYKVDMPTDGKGAKGGDVMTKTHATGSAMSYGKRYLANFVFNLAIGDVDDDGNGGQDWGKLEPCLRAIREAPDLSALTTEFKKSYAAAKAEQQATAMLAIANAFDARKKELWSEGPA